MLFIDQRQFNNDCNNENISIHPSMWLLSSSIHGSKISYFFYIMLIDFYLFTLYFLFDVHYFSKTFLFFIAFVLFDAFISFYAFPLFCAVNFFLSTPCPPPPFFFLVKDPLVFIHCLCFFPYLMLIGFYPFLFSPM